MSDAVLEERRDGVALLTLNSPDKLNAWSGDIGVAYEERLRAADADPDVRAVVVTGAGRGFCAGADISSLRQERAATDGPRSVGGHGTGPSLAQVVRVPVIAAVNGATAGLGFALALWCDVRIAGRSARFTTAFARLGLVAEYGVSWMLPRVVGHANAMDLLLSGRIIDADEALAMGLANKVVDDDQLLEEAMAYAALLARNAPRSMAIMKEQVYRDAHSDVVTAVKVANQLQGETLLTPDFREGITAFAERRPPVFPPTDPA